MADPNYRTATDVFCELRNAVLSGTPPIRYPIGDGNLAGVAIGPGLVTLFGGAPGSGKTAVVMQGMIDALRLTPSLKICVTNVEMAPAVLMERQLARLSGIDLDTIQYRRLSEVHAERLQWAFDQLEAVTDRLCFVRPPYDLQNVAAVADDFDADVLVLDYIQRIAPGGNHNDKRGSVDATMDFLRQFADAGQAVIVVSAVGRTKDSRGRSSYDSQYLNLASFRESSELEFGADDAYMVTTDTKQPEALTLRHLKARHGKPTDVELRFDGAHQSLTSWLPGERREALAGFVRNQDASGGLEAGNGQQ